MRPGAAESECGAELSHSQDTGSPAWTVTDLLVRNGDFLVKVGGEGLLRVASGMWEGGVAVGRVDGTKAGRVSMVPRSTI